MARLILHPGRPDERVFELREGANTIGRTRQNDVFVLHKSLSRQHARLVVDGERFEIEDLGSKNGTFVDGERVERRVLGGTHQVKCGDVVFRFVTGVERIPAVADEPTRPTLVYDVGQDPATRSLDQMLAARQPTESGTALNLRGSLDGERTQEKLQILLKVSEVLSSPAPLDEVLGRVLDLAFRILDIDRGTVVLCEGTDLRTAASRSRSDPSSDGSENDRSLTGYSNSVVRWVLGRGVAALFRDTANDPRLVGSKSILRQSIRASMCAPLRARDRLLGVLYVDNLTRPDRFTEEDLEFVSAFANQAAISIDNAMLRDELADQAVARNTLMRFFPPTSVDAIMSSGASLEAIEAEATILFCDISGFTELSSRLQPKDVIALLNRYFPVMSDIVFHHEGTLEKYIGDALLAVWGVPMTREDDAVRAVAAAVDMQRAMVELNDVLALDEPLRIHVGINSGRVAAGNIGSKQLLQYATIGDATNVAARVCGAAGPGEILVDEATVQRLGEPAWPLTALPPFRVKGKSAPLALYRLRYDD
ncbi:MAG TPA: GAF domain-containing protein [Polyangiaceae bacterium]|nr:GAF domain-containing protein [Polyangiaceae bacterium]